VKERDGTFTDFFDGDLYHQFHRQELGLFKR
jgi:hypothetical protein